MQYRHIFTVIAHFGDINHKHSSAFVAVGPLALWSHPFNKNESPPLACKRPHEDKMLILLWLQVIRGVATSLNILPRTGWLVSLVPSRVLFGDNYHSNDVIWHTCMCMSVPFCKRKENVIYMISFAFYRGLLIPCERGNRNPMKMGWNKMISLTLSVFMLLMTLFCVLHKAE